MLYAVNEIIDLPYVRGVEVNKCWDNKYEIAISIENGTQFIIN